MNGDNRQVEARRLRLGLLQSVLGETTGRIAAAAVEEVVDRHRHHRSTVEASEKGRFGEWSHHDIWLITYADQFQAPGERPLATLNRILADELGHVIEGVHILPFHPWSSDDGFSVIDYGRVDDRYGDWSDIAAIGESRRLMVDAVINHVSAESDWFQRFLADEEPYNRFFPHLDPGTDVSRVVRPRTHPLLTRYDTAAGERWVWTTFSADQIDLDYRNPEVIVRILEVLVTYVERGGSAIRLDAVGFLWKDPERSSIHLPETHAIIQLYRSCLDEVAPGTILISETNVPHAENISYLHEDPPEVHAVYQFALPPLAAHAALTGDTTALAAWADGIDDVVGPQQSFLNFLASHDGIGLRPIEGILDATAVAVLVEATEAVGGRISYRSTADGGQQPYELNTTWFDLLSHGVTEETAIGRHLATHAALLALPGIAAIYVHSLFGSSNDQEGFAATGHNRSLNRARFVDADGYFAALGSDGGGNTDRAARVLDGLAAMVAERRRRPAFHPEGACRARTITGSDLIIEREHAGSRGGCLINFSDRRLELTEPVGGLGTLEPYAVHWYGEPSARSGIDPASTRLPLHGDADR
ncbi:MAG: alpha-amylase family glycosyl hydrolase [Acidimicrobiia bacterium]|nr:alpha-amylase family glycosyl hydrolase [Acidimicrobiia bacterium]